MYFIAVTCFDLKVKYIRVYYPDDDMFRSKHVTTIKYTELCQLLTYITVLTTLSLTLALVGCGLLMPHPDHFTPGNDLVTTLKETGWAPGKSGRLRKTLPPLGLDPRTVQPVVSSFSDYAILVRAAEVT